jgi:formylglycine-generating enzyme required for sulfatase activity
MGKWERAWETYDQARQAYVRRYKEWKEPKEYLRELGKENTCEIELYFHMPYSNDEPTWESAYYYAILHLLPTDEANYARKQLLIQTPKEDSDYLLQELYKAKYILAERPLWADYMLEKGKKLYPSELKEMLLYIQKPGDTQRKWILDMASPYWTRLPVKCQQRYARLYQEGYAKELKLPKERSFSYQGVNFEMVFIPPGQFLMGAPHVDGYPEGPQHQVILSEPFWMGKYEVTQKQWEAVDGTSPWCKENGEPEKFAQIHPEHAANYISWQRIMQSFLPQFNTSTQVRDQKWQLPDEMMWEYTYRAGTTTSFYWGRKAEDIGKKENLRIAPHCERFPQPKGEPSPLNTWGIYNMADNVAEWCSNAQVRYTKTRKVDRRVSMENEGKSAMVRGGYFLAELEMCRASYRFELECKKGNAVGGFRLALK